MNLVLAFSQAVNQVLTIIQLTYSVNAVLAINQLTHSVSQSSPGHKSVNPQSVNPVLATGQSTHSVSESGPGHQSVNPLSQSSPGYQSVNTLSQSIQLLGISQSNYASVSSQTASQLVMLSDNQCIIQSERRPVTASVSQLASHQSSQSINQSPCYIPESDYVPCFLTSFCL